MLRYSLRSFALRLIRYSVMISGRRRRRLLAGGDVRMIATTRSRFSDYRFDGGAADCLRGFVVPWQACGVGRSSRLVRGRPGPCVSHLPGC